MAPFSSLWGYLFLCIFGYPKKHVFCSQRVPKWRHFGGHFWYLFRIGRKSIFEDPYIENTAFSLPRAAQNESKNHAKMGYPKRHPKSEKKSLKTTPLGTTGGTTNAPQGGAQKHTRKKKLKNESARVRWSPIRHGFSPPRTPPLLYYIIKLFLMDFLWIY